MFNMAAMMMMVIICIACIMQLLLESRGMNIIIEAYYGIEFSGAIMLIYASLLVWTTNIFLK